MRIGLICDIHEDFRSLREALRQLERRNCDELVCLGDIVGYDTSCCEHGQSRNPSACIAAIRSDCRHVVVGNHDLFALKKVPQSTHAFSFPPNWYELSLDERRTLSDNRVWLYETESPTTRLNRKERRYLGALPEHLVLQLSNQLVYFSHSYHPDVTGSLMLHPHNPWDLREHLQILRNNRCSYGFSGHMHANGVVVGREDNIREASFGKLGLEQSPAQYSCPGVSSGSGAQGFTIINTADMSIETIRLNGQEKRWEKWYERLLKRS